MTADDYSMQLAASLTPAQQQIFYAEYHHRAKEYSTALVLAILLGLLGVHKFYLGRTGQGILHLALSLFSAFTLGIVLVIVDIFRLRGTVYRVNREIADKIAASVQFHVVN